MTLLFAQSANTLRKAFFSTVQARCAWGSLNEPPPFPRSEIARKRTAASKPEDDSKHSAEGKQDDGPSTVLSGGSATQSLLAELFPQETQRSKVKAARTRKINKLPLRPVYAGGKLSSLLTRPGGDAFESEAQEEHEQHHVVTVKRVGKNLIEEDFRRLVPGGSHLEGWSAANVLLKGALGLVFEINGR